MGKKTEKDIGSFRNRIKWLILLRLIVTFPLLSAIVFFQAGNNIPSQIRFYISIYGLSGILVLSFCYSFVLYYLKKGEVVFAYFQIIADTVFVTFIRWILQYFSVFVFCSDYIFKYDAFRKGEPCHGVSLQCPVWYSDRS